MLATQITTHVQDALNRLLQQYKGQPQLADFITSLVTQIQNLEDAIFSLDAGRQVFNAIGEQLDNLGTLVDFPRNALPDDQYLLFILGKIGENFSDTTADKVSQVYAVLLNSGLVQEQDLYPGAAGFSAASTGVQSSLIPIIFQFIQGSLGAGIRLDFLSIFDPGNAFAFDGGPAQGAAGFGDLNDPTIGGMFASLLVIGNPFAFASSDPTDTAQGFGSLLDPNIGGLFQSL